MVCRFEKSKHFLVCAYKKEKKKPRNCKSSVIYKLHKHFVPWGQCSIKRDVAARTSHGVEVPGAWASAQREVCPKLLRTLMVYLCKLMPLASTSLNLIRWTTISRSWGSRILRSSHIASWEMLEQDERDKDKSTVRFPQPVTLRSKDFQPKERWQDSSNQLTLNQKQAPKEDFGRATGNWYLWALQLC